MPAACHLWVCVTCSFEVGSASWGTGLATVSGGTYMLRHLEACHSTGVYNGIPEPGAS